MTDQPGALNTEPETPAPGFVWCYGESHLQQALDRYCANMSPDDARAVRHVVIAFHESDAMGELEFRF